MRLLLVLMTVMIGAVAAVEAEPLEYPWCANFADGAGTNCGFVSYDQCMKTATPGTGGYCAENPFYKGPVEAPRRRGKRSPQKKD